MGAVDGLVVALGVLVVSAADHLAVGALVAGGR